MVKSIIKLTLECSLLCRNITNSCGFIWLLLWLLYCVFIFFLTFLVRPYDYTMFYDNFKLFVLEWKPRKKSERVFKPMHWIHHEYNTYTIYVQNIEYFLIWQLLGFISPSRVHRYYSVSSLKSLNEGWTSLPFYVNFLEKKYYE